MVGDDTVVLGYKVSIDTGEPIRIGIRRVEEMGHLSVLAGRVQEKIGRHSFPGQEPTTSYLVCTLKLPRHCSGSARVGTTPTLDLGRLWQTTPSPLSVRSPAISCLR